MRLVSFNNFDGPRIGLVVNNEVIDLTSVNADAPRDMQQVIANGELPALKEIATEALAANQSHHRPFHDLDFNMPRSEVRILPHAPYQKAHLIEVGFFISASSCLSSFSC